MTFLMGRLELESRTQSGEWLQRELAELRFDPGIPDVVLEELMPSLMLRQALQKGRHEWARPEQGSEGYPESLEVFLKSLRQVYGPDAELPNQEAYTVLLLNQGVTFVLSSLLKKEVTVISPKIPMHWRLTLSWQDMGHKPAVWEWNFEPYYVLVKEPKSSDYD